LWSCGTPDVDPDLNARVVTHSFGVVAAALDLHLELIFLGGLHRPQQNAVEGSWPLEMIGHFHADKAFPGADGLHPSAGLTTPSMATASIAVAGVELAMVRRIRGEVVVLADHSKIGLVGDAVVCPLDQIDLLLVDDGVDAGVCEEIRRAGPRCEVV
jgi:DeoR family fructose operon transcriptional repressor